MLENKTCDVVTFGIRQSQLPTFVIWPRFRGSGISTQVVRLRVVFVYFSFLSFFFFFILRQGLNVVGTVSICSSGSFWTYCLPASASECWDYRCVSPHMAQSDLLLPAEHTHFGPYSLTLNGDLPHRQINPLKLFCCVVCSERSDLRNNDISKHSEMILLLGKTIFLTFCLVINFTLGFSLACFQIWAWIVTAVWTLAIYLKSFG
jgi:hypothetical protein